MPTKGYDADRFQKLVAMFESPSPAESTNAFRLAVEELKKKLAAIDQQTLSIKLQVEYEALRRDLQKELLLSRNGNRSADEYEISIERLYRRISMVEENVSDEPPVEPSEPDPPEGFPSDEGERYNPDLLNNDHQTAQPSEPETIPLALEPPHQSTIIAPFIAWLKGFSPLEAFYTVFCIIWILSGFIDLYSRFTIWGLVFLLVSAAVWVLLLTFRKYGRDGVLVKICLFFDALLLSTSVALGRDPFSWPSHQHALWWTPRPLMAYLLFLLSLALIVWLPESWMGPILDDDNDKLQQAVIAPGVVALVVAVMMYFDPSLFGNIPRPLVAPAFPVPAVPHVATPPPAAHHHQKHKPHPTAFQFDRSPALNGPALSATSPNVQSCFIFWPFALLGGGGLFLNGRRIHAKALKERAAAQKAAHEFKAPNVHGNAGYASKADARKKGWI